MHYTKTTKPRTNDVWKETGPGTWDRPLASGGAARIVELEAMSRPFWWSVSTGFSVGAKEPAVSIGGQAESLTLAKAAVLQAAKRRGLVS